MSLNDFAFNEVAINEGQQLDEELIGYASIIGETASAEDLQKGRVVIVGNLHHHDHFGKITLKGELHQVSYQGAISIKGEIHQLNYDSPICIVSVVRELPIQVGPHSVASSTISGVLPQTGSAIFTKWEPIYAKEVLIRRHWDKHETARVNFDDKRRGWRLEVDVNATIRDDFVQFFEDHYWAGKGFYFYDLESNGYVYDGTGAETNGRYRVRFVEEDFPVILSIGSRFRIAFSVIEID